MMDNTNSYRPPPDTSWGVTSGHQGYDYYEYDPARHNVQLRSYTTRANGDERKDVPDDDDDDDDDGDADGQAVDKANNKPKKRNLCFRDGKSKIDYILAWTTEKKEETEKAKEARKVFEANLVEEGLELEYELQADIIHYAKIHAPFSVLKRYADILKMRMPIKAELADQHIKDHYTDWKPKPDPVWNPLPSFGTRVWQYITHLFKKFLTPFEYDHSIFPDVERPYTSPYSSSKEYLFEIPEVKEDLFNNATRSWIVDYILRRQPFSENPDEKFSYGINKMITDGYYDSAYPLHEGHWKAGSADNTRKRLYDHWACWKNAFKFQPLDYVRKYFGEKIGLYFAWLGFYTTMLVPATVVGLVVFFYGLAIMATNVASRELCDATNITMCPMCDGRCPYWKLSEACGHAMASRIFDNGATVFFAIFMSLWGTLFLEFWKRKQATIQYKWDLSNFVFEEEPPRPEYLSKLQNWTDMKVNPITGIKEPHLPFWRRRFPIFLCSYSIMLFLAAVAVTAVIGVIAYRVSMLAALQLIPKEVKTNSTIVTETAGIIYKNASLVTTVTAALINLLIIILLNMIYSRLAFWLTDWECLRTQTEYDNSITIKLFALQFVNYFSSIVYIAFFKGQFVGRPGKYRRIFGGRQEECESGGCLIELCIQLAIIMVGKQLIQNNLIEIVVPWLMKFFKKKCSKENKELKLARTPWQKDFKLETARSMSLFYEYLEMVLQFGFLTIFCAAFPLAPLFALINNIMEIRLDATKFTTVLRRSLAEKAATIGVWYSVLYGISRIAIISNAFIIALTSEYIPRLVYKLRYSDDDTLTGYVNFTLAYFNTADFKQGEAPVDGPMYDTCRYKDYRNPPWDEPRYRRSEVFWHILTARLAFVCIFENVVVVLTSLISWLIPDMPAELKEKLRKENYITHEIILKTELERAKGHNPLSKLAAVARAARDQDQDDGRYSPKHSDDIEIYPNLNADEEDTQKRHSKTYV